MIEIVGQYNTAICYTGELEEAAAGQIKAVCDQPAFGALGSQAGGAGLETAKTVYIRCVT